MLEGRVGIAPLPLSRPPVREGSDEAQPFYVNSPYGIALAHNGNLINTDALRREVFEQDRRNVNTESDSEVLLNVFAHELDTQKALTPGSRRSRAVEGVQPPRQGRLRGGQRGARPGPGGVPRSARHPPAGARQAQHRRPATNTCVASESVALDVLGFERVRDVAPGEAHRRSPRAASCSRSMCAEPQQHAPCIFEYVYFARPDSMIDDISVHKARMRMGVTLGEKILRAAPRPRHRRRHPDPRHLARCRAGDRQRARREVPRGLHQEPLRRPHLHHAGAGRAREVGAPQAQPDPAGIHATAWCCWSTTRSCAAPPRSRSCRWRATPAPRRSTSPPPRRRCAIPNIYGIDMPSADELVAHDRTEEEIEQLLGCDWLIYQDLADLEDGRRRPEAPGPHVRQLVLQRRVRHRHRAGLLRAHPAAALGRGEEEARASDVADADGFAVRRRARVPRRGDARGQARARPLQPPPRSPRRVRDARRRRAPPDPIRMPGRPPSARAWCIRANCRGAASAATKAARRSSTPSRTSSSTRSTWRGMRSIASAACRPRTTPTGSAWPPTKRGTSRCCATRLREFGHDYGDFDAHNGLWEMAEKTAHDALARMALVPRVLEARGLDVTPGHDRASCARWATTPPPTSST